MRKLCVVSALWLACGAAAYSAGVDIHRKGVPSFVDNGLTLTTFGQVTGMRLGSLQIDFSATANATVTCTSSDGQTVPAQRSPQIGVSATPIIVQANSNGTASFTLTTNPPASPIPGAPDCPSGQWTEQITDLAFTSAIIPVEQPIGDIALVYTCAFSLPTINGPVASKTVTCH